MEPKSYMVHRLVKSEDLNHHGTLFAGRSAEWFVESGFIAACSLAKPENIVCLHIHGMTFNAPVQRGDIVRFESKIVDTGRSRIIAYIDMKVKDTTVVQGFITFIHIDSDGRPVPHGITITPTDPVDVELQQKARNLKND